jgi:CHAT domain-containing protein
MISGVPVPLTFRVHLVGTVADQAFGPLIADLRIARPAAGSCAPVGILLAPAYPDGPGANAPSLAVGDALWVASLADAVNSGDASYRIAAADGVLTARIDAPVSGSTVLTVNVPQRYGAMPTPVSQAELTLRFQRAGTLPGSPATLWQVDGELTARTAGLLGGVHYAAALAGTAGPAPLLDLGGAEARWAGCTTGRPGAVPPASATAATGGTPDWRATRDAAFDLVLASDLDAAIPLLYSALDSCRDEQRRVAGAPSRLHAALIDEMNILTRLVSCHRRAGDWPRVLPALRASVAVQRQLNAAPHLGMVTSADAPAVVANLTDAIEAWGRELADDLGRIELLDETADVFEALADVFASLGRPDAALAAAERGRARVLADLVAGMPVPALTVEMIQATVDRYGATVVEYLLTEERSWALLARPGEPAIAVRLAAGREHIEKLVAQVVPALEQAARAALTRSPAAVTATLEELYDLLIRPIPADLLTSADGRASGTAVAVVAHHGLAALPWLALRDRDAGYLCERLAVCAAPSIGTLAAARVTADPPAPVRGLLTLVNPRPLPAGLRPLPAVEAAASQFAALVERSSGPGTARAYSGEAATLARLREARPGEVVLLGAHGVAERRDSAAVHVVLAPDEARGHDGRATPEAISGLGLDSPLVALLACRGGVGPITSDGALAVSRAFVAAGAGCLLSSLWDVGDDTGMEIIYRTLENWLAGGLPRAEAFRRAVASLADELPDRPEQWGAFQLTGAWS